MSSEEWTVSFCCSMPTSHLCRWAVAVSLWIGTSYLVQVKFAEEGAVVSHYQTNSWQLQDVCAGLNGKGTLARLQGNLQQFIPQMLLYYPVVPSSQFTSSRDRISSILLSRGSSLEVDWQVMSLLVAISCLMNSVRNGIIAAQTWWWSQQFLCFPPYLKNILSQSFGSFSRLFLRH